MTGNKEIVIPAETVIAFKLARPKTVVGKAPAPAATPASTPGAASGQSP
jgi:hypothetical protein